MRHLLLATLTLLLTSCYDGECVERVCAKTGQTFSVVSRGVLYCCGGDRACSTYVGGELSRCSKL